MLDEGADASRSPVKDRSPHLPLFPEFMGASYPKRYDLFCRRRVQEQLYTTASVIASPRSANTPGDYTDLTELTRLKTFVISFAGHGVSEAAR